MSAASPAAVLEAAGPAVARRLASVEARLRAVAATAGAPLGVPATATVEAGGKRLRPLLVLLAAGEPRGDAAGEAVERAAVAVELVHSATLVHDDVLDRAQLRRGVPTVWASDGREMAVSVGDHLFARAFSQLARNGDPEQVRVLSDASSALADGELLQREDAWSVPAVDRYLHRCELKTARLFEAACRLGALAGGDAASADWLGAFGRRIGLAFQILDDVLDVQGPAERTGKPRGTDLLDGTVTLPLILARDRSPQLAALDLRAVTTPQQAEELCTRIAASGALDEARARALAMVAEAKAGLRRDDPALLLVADGVVERYS